MEQTQPTNDSMTLRSLSQVRAFTDPLRQRIFETLLREAATAKQVAEILGTKPTRLYYHFAVLEKAGLIRKTRTNRKRGTVEKYYEASAARVEIDPSVLGAAGAPVDSLFRSTFETTLREVSAARAAAGEGDDPVAHLARLKIRTSPARRRALLAQLESWIEECESANEDDGAEELAVTLAFYETRAVEDDDAKQ